jgi:hypothetical protein
VNEIFTRVIDRHERERRLGKTEVIFKAVGHSAVSLPVQFYGSSRTSEKGFEKRLIEIE